MVKVEEIREVTKKSRPKPSKKPFQTAIVVSTTTTTTPKKKKNKSKNRGRIPLQDAFVQSMLYPDLVGPQRFPVYGSDARVVLGMERGRYTMVGSGTNYAQAVRINSSIFGLIGNSYGVANSSTVWGGGSSVSTAVQFPTSSGVADARLTTASLIVSYTGIVNNCAGELILGTYPDSNNFSLATYDALSYLPGTIRLPIATLINNPLRVSLRHAAPQSWDLLTVGSGQLDVEIPYIATIGLPSGQSISVELVKNYELRTVVNSSLAIPYSSSSAGRASDDASMTNALDFLSKRVNTITSMMPNAGHRFARSMIDGLFTGFKDFASQSAASAGGMILDAALRNAHNSVQSGTTRFIHQLL